MKHVKLLDINGYIPHLNVKSQKTRKLKSGGLITLFIIIIYCSLFSYFGQDCFQKKNPKGFSQQKKNSALQDSLKFSEVDFHIGYTLWSVKKGIINLTEFFFVNFEYETGIWKPDIDNFEFNYLPLEVFTCDNKFINNDVEIKNRNLTKYLCPNTTKIKEKGLRGDFSSHNFTSLRLRLEICDDKMECKNLTKIKELFKNDTIEIDVLYPRVEYAIDNPEKPFKTILRNTYNILSLNKYLYEKYLSNRYQLEEDIGILFEQKNFLDAFGIFDFYHFSEIFNPDDVISETNKNRKNSLLYETRYYYQDFKMYYHRNYLKIADILAQCASLLMIIVNITNFLYRFYADFSFENYLFKNLIFVEDEDCNDFNGNVINYSKFDKQNLNIFYNQKEKSEINQMKNTKGKIKFDKLNYFYLKELIE